MIYFHLDVVFLKNKNKKGRGRTSLSKKCILSQSSYLPKTKLSVSISWCKPKNGVQEGELSVHVKDCLVQLLLAAHLLGFAVSLGISNEVFKVEFAFLELFTLTAIK